MLTVSKVNAVAAVLLTAAISFAGGWIVGKGQAVPTPEPTNTAPDDKAADAVERLKAVLRHPDSLRVLKATSNAGVESESLMVEIDFEAAGRDGRAART